MINQMVETTKSETNIMAPIIENVIILYFLMAETSSKQQKNVHIGEIYSHFNFIWCKSIAFAFNSISQKTFPFVN